MMVVLIVFALSCFASMSLWVFSKKHIPLLLTGIALIVAVAGKLLPYLSVLLYLSTILFCYLYTKPLNKGIKVFLFTMISGIIFWCMYHIGFYSREIFLLKNYQLTPISKSFSIGENIEKTLCGIVLAAFLVSKARLLTEWKHIGKEVIFPLCLLSFILLFPTLFTGYVKFDFKISSVTLLFMAANLLLVCLSEEVFFRGFLQKNVINYLSNKIRSQKIAVFLSVVTVSIIFALFHLHGGVLLVLFAFIASVGYGYAYQQSQKIETAILVHFGINFIHFTFFTYPAYQASALH